MFLVRALLCIAIILKAEQCFSVECQLKAAIVLGISRLVKVESDINLCLLEGSNLKELLIRGSKSHKSGKSVVVHSVTKPESFCSIYYIDSSVGSFRGAFDETKTKRLMIVDEDIYLDFSVKLIKAEDRYHLVVNQSRLEGEGAKLDSSILRLAFRIIKS